MNQELERKRPVKLFRVVHAFGPYCKGVTFQPTGMYRDVLIQRGLIEEVKETPEAAPARVEKPLANRMVQGPDLINDSPALINRTRRAR